MRWVLSSLEIRDEERRNGFELQQGMLRMDIKRNFFTKRVIKLYNTLPREVVECLSLEVGKRCINTVLRDMI